MTSVNDDGSIMETFGAEVTRNAGGNICMRHQDDSEPYFTDGEAVLLLQGLAREMGYRLVKKKAEGGDR